MTCTVCSESVEVIPNEICVYSYIQKVVDTSAKTVEVPFGKQCGTQMVTVCQPTPGYGYRSYGHNYCKEVTQETGSNIPIVTPVDHAVKIAMSVWTGHYLSSFSGQSNPNLSLLSSLRWVRQSLKFYRVMGH